jgi:phospholipid-binding lipoprotein MlaA
MRNPIPGRFLTLLIALALALTCAVSAWGAVPSLDEDDENYLDQVARVPDPLEPWNRAMFRFNDALMDHVARPAYKGYAYVTPEFMRSGIKNFFHNLAFPVRFVNNLLQGRPRAAGVEMSRFILNSTAGLGGLIDVAKSHKPVVPVEDEDFGQTLGVWGVGEGFYIVWPLLGPSSARDTVGLVGDAFLDPVNYVQPWWLALSIDAGKTFNELDDILDLYDDLKRVAVEPYSSMRDAYIQYRKAKIAK